VVGRHPNRRQAVCPKPGTVSDASLALRIGLRPYRPCRAEPCLRSRGGLRVVTDSGHDANQPTILLR
jgi:hypothetical protein